MTWLGAANPEPCAAWCSGVVSSEAPKEDHSPATALDHTLNESDDWTLVEDEDADEAVPSKA